MRVLVQDATQSVCLPDLAVVESAGIDDRFRSGPQWRGALPVTVGSVIVVERFELAQRLQQVGVVPDQGPVEELAPAGLDPPLHDRIYPRRADGTLDDLDALTGEHWIERLAECGVAVSDQERRGRAGVGVPQIHDEVSGDLGNPGGGGVDGGTEDPDAAGGVFDDGEDVVRRAAQGGGGEDVAREDGFGLGG